MKAQNKALSNPTETNTNHATTPMRIPIAICTSR